MVLLLVIATAAYFKALSLGWLTLGLTGALFVIVVIFHIYFVRSARAEKPAPIWFAHLFLLGVFLFLIDVGDTGGWHGPLTRLAEFVTGQLYGFRVLQSIGVSGGWLVLVSVVFLGLLIYAWVRIVVLRRRYLSIEASHDK